MNAQWIVVGIVVFASAIYAAWSLMPASLRRVLSTSALRLPLPAAIAAWLRRHASDATSCGCSGCDRNPLSTPAAATPASNMVRPITLHRRTRG
jgi:hypothetical protein